MPIPESEQTPVPQDLETSPTDSGTKSEQKESAKEVAGELMPRPQLSRIADCVSAEASGLVTVDPAAMQTLGALRLATSYMNEQAVNTAALRVELANSQERERRSASEVSELRTALAVAKSINGTDKKLRAPRALVSLLGLTVAGFGVDQFGNGNKSLGIVLVLIGALMVGATYFIAPDDGAKS